MKTLFIIRHGNTFGPDEAPRRVGSATDIPLVESGRRQALALGEALYGAGVRPDRVLTSPLLRARETATLALQAFDATPPLETASFLAEIDHGPDENQTEDIVVGRIGQAAIDLWDQAGIAPEEWVVDTDSRHRAWLDFFAQASAGPHQTQFLVTSNGAARFALSALRSVGKEIVTPSMKLRTGAWGTFGIADNGEISLLSWDLRPQKESVQSH
jgi:broad specificity phosphatase PhoE